MTLSDAYFLFLHNTLLFNWSVTMMLLSSACSSPRICLICLFSPGPMVCLADVINGRNSDHR